MAMSETIPERLQKLRARCGLSGRELGKLAGLSSSACSAIEKGTGNYELKTLNPIASVLGCSLDYLVNGEGEPPNDEQLTAAVAAARAAKMGESTPNGGAAA